MTSANIRRGMILFCASVIVTIAGAQPAPIGPPSNRTTQATVPVSLMTDRIRTRAQLTVDETNLRLAADDESARVSVESLRAYKPSRAKTEMLNEPNSWYVQVPYMLTIKVAIPASFDRHIHIPIAVNVFCSDWHTNHGQISVQSVPGPASIEGGSILEDLIHVRDHIDAKVRNAFNPPLPLAMSLPSTRCASIGAFDNGTETVDDDGVAWDFPNPVRPRDSVVPHPTIVVTFDRLKRLSAHSSTGGILYKETEEILLNAYANYFLAQKGLQMREGDDVALDLPAVRLDARVFQSLIIIAGVDQPPNDPADSAFAPSGNARDGYATGTHVLKIPKWYSTFDPISHKPRMIIVPAYELSYTVKFVNPARIRTAQSCLHIASCGL